MSKFKPGDTVIKIKGDLSPYIGTVSRTEEKRNRCEIAFSSMVSGFISNPLDSGKAIGDTFLDSEECYELIVCSKGDSKSESELKRLVRVANDGYYAVDKLRNHYQGVIEGSSGGEHWGPVLRWPLGWKVRIKPEPAFKPFSVGNGWVVRLDDSVLHVGCTKFDAKEIKDAFESLQDGNCYKDDFNSYKNGIGRVGQPRAEITWAEVDLVLEALKKAGI